MTHIANQILNPELSSDNILHVISMVSNPARWHSRFRLARKFQEELRSTPNVQLHMVEVAHGQRQFEVTSDGDLQLRTGTEAWVKENAINLGARYCLPREAKYIAWVDADLHFRDKNWALETLHQLQHFEVVQPWQSCADLGPLGEICQLHESFGSVLQHGKPMQRGPGTGHYSYAHSGFAWACTRRFWEQTQGLLDFAILGAADHHMAFAMIGDSAWTAGGISPGYARAVQDWEDKAFRACQGQVGFTPTRIEHHFHGSKRARQYNTRWEILQRNTFDPYKDLIRDEQGLIHLVGKPKLEAEIRGYNRSRNEDGVEP